MPACRSLDCVSVLTPDVAAAERVLTVAGGPDPGDPYSRAPGPGTSGAAPAWGAAGARIAVPRRDQLEFCGDTQAAAAWEHALARATAVGWALTEIDFAPFAEAAALLYNGPWIAERYAAVGTFVAAHRDAVDPIVRQVIMAGRDVGAVAAFQAAHRLRELAAQTASVWQQADALLLPTAPTVFTAAQVAEEPILRNTLLGTYTNFVNLLDLCAIAVPASVRADGLPFGVSLVAASGGDDALLTLGAHWRDEHRSHAAGAASAGTVALAVVGAHLSGEPLNGQLVALGARRLETTRTAPTYRLYALPDTEPAKPGLVGGGPLAERGIELEIWELTTESFGRVVAGVPAPLSIGTITLEDGRAVKGFLCESSAVRDARDITQYGGWRAYRAAHDAAPRISTTTS